MWFANVDIPEDVVQAQTDGRLVLFVGAGASVDSPSDLPLFSGLTNWVAEQAGVEMTDADRNSPDEFLARLDEERDVDVHALVAQRLGVDGSLPNHSHRALAKLAARSPKPMLVTTNYDRHLSKAAADLGFDLREFVAPAVPIGRDFSGIVYVHGSLSGPERELVVTDADLGRAYLTDAWAVRFLEPMFREHVVVFVGYSHDDVVMRYLARGLHGANRYALTDEADGDWERLGIRPIVYENADGTHSEVEGCLVAWSDRVSMGLLEHRERVRTLTRGAPSAIPEEDSYLQSVIEDPELVQFFTGSARGGEWLDWISDRVPFTDLFQSECSWSESHGSLANWFAREFVIDEDLSPRSFSVLKRREGVQSQVLSSAIGHHLHVLGFPRPLWLRPWIAALLASDPRGGSSIEYALLATDWNRDSTTGISLLRHLLEPIPKLTERSFPSQSMSFEIDARGQSYWLTDLRERMGADVFGAHAATLLELGESALDHRYRLAELAGIDVGEFDPLSFSRATIEPHEQNRRSDGQDVAIDIVRDALEHLLAADERRGSLALERWEDRREFLFRRLAVHGYILRTDIDRRAKLSWLRSRTWFFERPLRHEVFQLLQVVLDDDSNPDLVDDLVHHVIAEAEAIAERNVSDYELFNLLEWIAACSQRTALLGEQIAGILARNPEFRVGEHPDHLSWTTAVSRIDEHSPFSAEDIVAMVSASPEDAHSEILNRSDGLDGPASSFDGNLTAVAAACAVNPDTALGLLGVVDVDPRVVDAVINGVARGSHHHSDRDAILSILLELELSEHSYPLSELLGAKGRDEDDGEPWSSSEMAQQLAAALFNSLDEGEPPDPPHDWLGMAINHPSGMLAQFWLDVASRAWQQADDWTGLPLRIRTSLEDGIAGTDLRSVLFQSVVASQALFLFGADREWWRQNVLPLFSWDRTGTAPAAWEGFMIRGRWNDAMLVDGLYDLFLETIPNQSLLTQEARRQFSRHEAALCMLSDLHPDEKGLLREIATMPEVDNRVDWVEHVTYLMSDLPSDAVEHQWTRWMRDYWANRLDSRPTRLTARESAAMSGWALRAGRHLPEAVDFALQANGGLDSHASVLLGIEAIEPDHKDAVARLLAHLLAHTDRPFYGCHDLERIYPQLSGVDADVDALVRGGLIRVGCTEILET